MKHTGLYIILLCALVSLAFGQWLVRSSAANCAASTKPYAIVAFNTNCIKHGDVYGKVVCDRSTATYYECASGCHTCDEALRQPLNVCDQYGTTAQCYPNSNFTFEKYLGNSYIMETFYTESKQCQGDPFSIRAYVRDKCMALTDSQALTMTCDNGVVVQNIYNTMDCSGAPISTSTFGQDNVCDRGQLLHCH